MHARGLMCRHSSGANWLAASIVLCVVAMGSNAQAHTPHDAIDSMQISPNYAEDSSLFVVVQNQLLRSTNRGATWKNLVTGLDSPYLLSDIAISRHYAKNGLIYVSTDGDGVYESRDRGQSWRSFNAKLYRLDVGRLLTVGFENDERVLAAGVAGGLFVTGAERAEWKRVISDDVQITSLAELTVESETHVFAGDAHGGVWRSDGDMMSWQRVFRVADSGSITSIEIESLNANGERLFIGTSKAGLWSTSDDGATLRNVSKHWPARTLDCRGFLMETAIPDRHVRDIASVALANGSIALYVSTAARAVHVSLDGGVTWQLRSAGLSCNSQADSDAFGVPHFRDIALGGDQPNDLFVAGFDGLFRSSDLGHHWTQLEALPISLVRGLTVSSADGDNHAVAITTYGGGAYISMDAGQTWSVANDGLISTRLSDIEFSPYFWDDAKLFSASMRRLLNTSESGKRWSASQIAYTGWRRKLGYGLERHLGVKADFGSRLFMSSAERRPVWPMEIELSPEFASDQTIVVGFRRHGIWKSEDGGNSWDRNWEGPIDWVSALEMSPNYSQDQTIFAAFRGAGIHVSRDGSKSWQSIQTTIDDFEMRPITFPTNYVMDPPLRRALNDIELSISPQFADDETVFAGSAAGLFRSVDGGTSWQQLTRGLPAENSSISAIGVSPVFQQDRSILVSVKGHGLFRSSDGGDSFVQISPQMLMQNLDLQVIRYSPTFATDRKIYGATDEALLESRDSGDSWNLIDRPIRYEDWRGGSLGPVQFSGNWDRSIGTAFSGSSQTESEQAGAKAALAFFGSEIIWRGEKGPAFGMARVMLDADTSISVDLYSNEQEVGAEIIRFSDLEMKPHSIVIEVSTQKNAQSSGNRVALDSFDLPSGSWMNVDNGALQ